MSRAGRPFERRLKNVVAVVEEHAEPGRAYYVNVRHDDDCPAITTQCLLDCTCDPVTRAPVEVQDMAEWMEHAKDARR